MQGGIEDHQECITSGCQKALGTHSKKMLKITRTHSKQVSKNIKNTQQPGGAKNH